jgi:hypothetical protein
MAVEIADLLHGLGFYGLAPLDFAVLTIYADRFQHVAGTGDDENAICPYTWR